MIKDTSSQDVILTPRNDKKRWLFVITISLALIIVLVLILPSLSRWSQADVSINTDRVRTAVVKKGLFIKDISLQGNIVAANSPKLYAPAVGTVTLLANPGETVSIGEKIAEVDSPELENKLQQEQSKLASLAIELERKAIEAKQAKMKSRQQVKLEEVVLEAAKREMRRAKQSIEIEVISQLDYEKAIDDLKRSQLKYDFAVEQAQLEKENLAFEIKTLEFEHNQYQLQVANTERRVKELNILAPVAGIVGSWSVEQKSAVTLNQPMMTVVDLSAFQVEIEIPESYADELGIGMMAKITYNNTEFDAEVITISPEVANNVVKGRLAFSAEPPPGIKQNQRVSGRVILEQREDVLFVPRGSFVQHHGGKKAFVIKDKIATLTNIITGSRSVNKIEILEGLAEGEEIIISNTDFVREAETLVLN